jgi:peptidoglycan/LPS O-acetylase OafA/YrhL
MQVVEGLTGRDAYLASKMTLTSLEVRPPDDSSAPVPAGRTEITYFYGIRGVSSVYVVLFHLNNIILAAHHGIIDPIYSRLTDWIRVGDFRVSAFFVISGYLLTLPTLKTHDWKLRDGVAGFIARRV